MAFLDNSGDIILDAVLTDTGRYRLAKGDGSFKIAKFALGDDEIDYSLYNKDHPSGSAYYDLDILQSPILEACTDNASALKSYLMSIAQTDLLFLPVITLFESSAATKNSMSYNNEKYFLVATDLLTEQQFTGSDINGVFFTNTPTSTQGRIIALDQGLDTTKISSTLPLSAELMETSYIVEMDNRLGSLLDQSNNEMPRSYIDDDQMATYLISIQKNTGGEIIKLGPATPNSTQNTDSSIRGPRGTRLSLSLKGTLELQTSTYLFEELGSEISINTQDYYSIDTNIRVTGATTGYRLDIPIRYIKKKTP
jgi:hypothetical protein